MSKEKISGENRRQVASVKPAPSGAGRLTAQKAFSRASTFILRSCVSLESYRAFAARALLYNYKALNGYRITKEKRK